MSKGFRTRYFEKVLGLAMILALNGPAHVAAWGMDAHRVIGMIADQHLTPGVKNKIQQDFNITSLADVANWADRVRYKRSQGRWHYANVREGKRNYVRERDCPLGRCVVEKIRYFSSVLAGAASSREGRIESLKYLVHFVGDIHQPLHLGNKKDRGGNKIRVVFQGEETNLHALWDSDLVPVAGGEDLLQYARRLIRRILPEDRLLWSRSGAVDWANESRKQALDLSYDPQVKITGVLTKGYVRKARETIELRLTQAGVRLAHLLNTLLE